MALQRRAFLLWVVLSALVSAAWAGEEDATRKALTIRQRAPIEFGVFSGSASGGTITIDAQSGGRRVSGNIALLGGNYGQAEFEITGQPAEEVMLNLPGEIVLDNKSAGGALTLTQLQASPDGIITLDQRGQARVRVGGSLRVAPRTTSGQYSGFFTLDARYLR